MELRLTYRYIKDHPGPFRPSTDFSAYFMEKPGFRSSGIMTISNRACMWICDIPANMKITVLLRPAAGRYFPPVFNPLSSPRPGRKM